VVILTGTGDAFIARGTTPKPAWTRAPAGSAATWSPHALWDKTYWEGKKLLMNLLDIEVPVISAINGSARVHSEIPLLCDIVLADEATIFQDGGHFPRGIPSGDGVHVVYPLLMGWNRGRYFLLTGQEIGAKRALDLGLVNEVLPRARLLPRAWELAEQLARQPVLNLRYTRVSLTMHLKRMLQDYLGYGLAVEGLAAVEKELAGG
jgi:enoyl-CoA hydratase/carnithine racemase